jgi:hypothetical protein
VEFEPVKGKTIKGAYQLKGSNVWDSAAFTFTLICIWAFRYPGSVEEYDRRVKEGKKIGWLK